jgi:hypothetical protein
MAQHSFAQYNGGQGGGGSVDPNELSVPGSYHSPSFNNFNSNSNNPSNAFSTGAAVFDDDELLDGLSPTEVHGQPQEFNNMNNMNMGFNPAVYSPVNGYSNTPDGEPIQSPFVPGFNNAQFRQMHHPMQYSGSPITGQEINTDDYMKSRARMSQQMQRKTSNTRSPMTPKTNAAMHALSLGSPEPGFGPQPIRTSGFHDKSPSGPWMPTPGGSMGHSYGSGLPSPIGQPSVGINEVMLKGGTSMPTKLSAVSSQEMKRKRRRESHNAVERRRRDNINERIQDLSRLVPNHRLEDEKIRKLIQNGTPLSPTLTGMSSPGQATSGLAGPGARRATGGTAGNITTGLPIEEKDKGPNKGDILNGSVSWTRDLMWMLHLKLQQQEELMNMITELGGHFPFELTEDEKRMQTELMDAMSKSDGGPLSYSRTAGSGLRVPHHTDYRGDTLNSTGGSSEPLAISPGNHSTSGLSGGLDDPNQFWNDPDDDGSGNNSINFKEEEEYDMDITQ